jgi:hypothetical protein
VPLLISINVVGNTVGLAAPLAGAGAAAAVGTLGRSCRGVGPVEDDRDGWIDWSKVDCCASLC